jgi:hypothetical protein
MPAMDIRSFFKSKGTAATKEKPPAADETMTNSTAVAAAAKSASTKASKQPPPLAPSAKSIKHEEIVIEDTDDEETTPVQKTITPGKRKSEEPKDNSNVKSNTNVASSSPSKKVKLSPGAASKLMDDKDTTADDRRTSPRKRQQSSSPPITTSTQESAAKKPKAKTSTATKKKNNPDKQIILVPEQTARLIDTDALYPECLRGTTWVFSGVLDTLSRTDSEDLIKTCGGATRTSVTGKTNYLVVGDVLEDGRQYTEGSKFKAALQKSDTVHVIRGVEAMYGLILQYDAHVRSRNPTAELPCTSQPDVVASIPPPVPAAVPSNPYAKSVTNPYARPAASSADGSVNPYAKKTTALSTQHTTVADSKKPAATTDSINALWVDKYKPTCSGEILGNQESAKKLAVWLAQWEDRFNTPDAAGKAFSAPHGPWKAALLSGPPGIGSKFFLRII